MLFVPVADPFRAAHDFFALGTFIGWKLELAIGANDSIAALWAQPDPIF